MRFIKCRFIRIKRKLTQIPVFLLLFLALAHCAHAGIATIAVSPVSNSITLSKGQTQSVTFTAYNNSDETQQVSVEPRYWFMADENKAIPLESWLKITPLEFDIGPKEKKEVVCNVTPPQEAVGELATMIAFRPKPKEGQAINVVFSVSLYVRLEETERIEYKISDFKLWKFEDRDSLGLKVVLKNDGNIHLRPQITVYIQDIFNKLLQKGVLEYGKPTYPGRTQDYHGAIYNFKLKPGLYKARIDTEYTNIPERFRKIVYFLVGKDGKVLLTFFRRPRG